MWGHGCGNRVFCGALRSPNDFPAKTESVLSADECPSRLASCSCSSSFRISSSWVFLRSYKRANSSRGKEALPGGVFAKARPAKTSGVAA